MYVFIGIACVAAAGIALVLILAAGKPGVFRVERTANIKAPAETLFPYINDFHNWASWSPFEKFDPNMKKTFSGEPSGQGAIYEWSGNGRAGVGRMEIKESSPAQKIVIELRFTKPFECQNTSEFTMKGSGNSTDITWAMHGPVPFIAKIFHVFMNMDRMLGKDFEEGLSNLKNLAEK